MPKTPRDPFDTKLTPEQRDTFARWLADEVQAALDARGSHEREIDYWHLIYEQGRTRLASRAPWAGAADLTSYIGTQNVDAIHARLMKTIAVEPVYTVEGWGSAAQNAPFVEEFTQWKVEDDRLQTDLDKLALISMIEPRGLMEVYEDATVRPIRKQINAAVQTDPTSGGPIYGENGQPQLQIGPDGRYVEADPGALGYATTVIDSYETVRKGPQQRVIPYRDSVILPGHARERREIWGYGKRIWKRMPEIEDAAEAGLYDKEAVAALPRVGEREPDAALTRSGQAVAPQEGPTAEKELWEVLVLADPDDQGERWYVATIHLANRILLRLQYDDLERSRFVPVILFPRPDRATEGFSLIGHKLITSIEEHTAWRNMNADRAAMVLAAPIKRLQGALWDPQEQPWGPNAVIDVRDMREIEPIQIPDLPASAVQREQTMERTAERLAGVNDISSGQFATENKTLGEIQMATEQSFVRMDLVIRRFQEAMEDLAQIRHALHKRAIAEQPEGVPVPQSVMTGLEARGQELPTNRITATMLEGNFRFKPRGSVETADPRAMRMDFTQMLQALPGFVQSLQVIGQMFGPLAVRSMIDQFIRVYRVQNRQAFIGGMSGFLGGGGQPPQPGMPGMPPPGMAGPPGLGSPMPTPVQPLALPPMQGAA